MQQTRRPQWDPHQNQVLPSDAMPRRLLDTSNFQFKLSQVYSQISQQQQYLQQSQMIESSRSPGVVQTNDFHIDNVSHNASMHYASPSQHMQKSHQDACLSYDFSVKHFGLLCDRSYLQHSEAFRNQKFGNRKRNNRVLTGGVKLDPIEVQPKHNVPLNTYSKQTTIHKQQSLQPYSSLEGWDERTNIRKIVVSQSGRSVVISFLTFEAYVRNQENNKKTRRAFYAPNLSVLKYLLQFSGQEINALFEKYAELIVLPSQKKKEQESIQLDFTGFEGIVEELRRNNNNNNEESKLDSQRQDNNDNNSNQLDGQSAWPKESSQQSEKQQDITYKISYPKVELYVNDIRWKKSVQLSKDQIKELISNDFKSLPEYIKYFDEEETIKLEPQNEIKKQSEEILLIPEESLKAESREEKPKIGLPSSIPLEELEEEQKKNLNFIIDNQQNGKPLAELLQQKYFKQIVDDKAYTLISFQQKKKDNLKIIFWFSPSKIRLKRIEVDHSQFITHNLTFQEFYELAALSKDQDILEYFSTKLRFFPELENQIIGQNQGDTEEDVTIKRRASFKKKIDLQLPAIEFDKVTFVEINEQSEKHGLLKEVEGTVDLQGSTFSIKIEPPFFEVHYSEENRREIQIASVSKINEIFKRGFNFSFKVIN